MAQFERGLAESQRPSVNRLAAHRRLRSIVPGESGVSALPNCMSNLPGRMSVSPSRPSAGDSSDFGGTVFVFEGAWNCTAATTLSSEMSRRGCGVTRLWMSDIGRDRSRPLAVCLRVVAEIVTLPASDIPREQDVIGRSAIDLDGEFGALQVTNDVVVNPCPPRSAQVVRCANVRATTRDTELSESERTGLNGRYLSKPRLI
jgi:hypothetical protein